MFKNFHYFKARHFHIPITVRENIKTGIWEIENVLAFNGSWSKVTRDEIFFYDPEDYL